MNAQALETVYLDLETTGLSSYSDEILEVGLVDDQDQVLMSSLVRPVRVKEWPGAQDIHGIAPADVIGAPHLQELLPRLRDMVVGRRVVAYGAEFETSFLPWLLEVAAEVCCCMAEWAGDPEAWELNDGRWWTLGAAARHVGHPASQLHRAVADARACRAVWRAMHDPVEAAQRRDREATRKAEHLLWWEASREAHEASAARELHGRAWLKAHGFRDPDILPHHLREQREKAYALLFFRTPLAVLKQEERHPGRTLVRFEGPCAPPGYIRAREARAELPRWLRNLLEPDAYLITGRSWCWLYSEAQIQDIWDRYPLRKPYTCRPGHTLATRTELRRAGWRTPELDQLKPVHQERTEIHHRWYYLYEVPTERAQRSKRGPDGMSQMQPGEGATT